MSFDFNLHPVSGGDPTVSDFSHRSHAYEHRKPAMLNYKLQFPFLIIFFLNYIIYTRLENVLMYIILQKKAHSHQ